MISGEPILNEKRNAATATTAAAAAVVADVRNVRRNECVYIKICACVLFFSHFFMFMSKCATQTCLPVRTEQCTRLRSTTVWSIYI